MLKIVENHEQLMDAINSKPIVVVDFYADWCGPCRMLLPIIEELAKEMNDVLFVKANVDINRASAQEFGVKSVPTLFLYKNKKRVSERSGYQPKANLVSWIKNTN